MTSPYALGLPKSSGLEHVLRQAVNHVCGYPCLEQQSVERPPRGRTCLPARTLAVHPVGPELRSWPERECAPSCSPSHTKPPILVLVASPGVEPGSWEYESQIVPLDQLALTCAVAGTGVMIRVRVCPRFTCSRPTTGKTGLESRSALFLAIYTHEASSD